MLAHGETIRDIDSRFAAGPDWTLEKQLQALEPMVKSHLCGDCGGALSLGRRPAGADVWPWSLRCNKCGFRDPDETYAKRKRGEYIMPIKGLTETLRLPRIGKIHLGIKKISPKSGKEYPEKTDYFVFPAEHLEEVAMVYGSDKPKELAAIIPVEDTETFASQYYRAYSKTRGLICRGDGEMANQIVDVATGHLAVGDSPKVEQRQVVCAGEDCPHLQAKRCKALMCLQFMLPDMPGLGVWQVDTGSINSILNINSDVAMVRSVVGHIRMVPLSLTLEPQQVTSPDDGKKKTIFVLHLRAKGSLGQLLQAAKAPLARFALPAPTEIDDEGYADADIPESEIAEIDKKTGEIVTAADKAFDDLRSAAPVTVEASSVPNPTPEPEKQAPAGGKPTKQHMELVGEWRFYAKKLGKDEGQTCINAGVKSLEDMPTDQLASIVGAMLKEMTTLSRK